jgi:hypothetical protein
MEHAEVVDRSIECEGEEERGEDDGAASDLKVKAEAKHDDAGAPRGGGCNVHSATRREQQRRQQRSAQH